MGEADHCPVAAADAAHPLFTVGISTCGRRAGRLPALIAARRDLRFLVIHQIMDSQDDLSAAFASLPHCDYVAGHSTGLSVSRNLAVDYCKTRFLLLSDDDVDYPADLSARLASVLGRQARAAAVIGKAMAPDGGYLKRYGRRRTGSACSFFSVSSIEIIINIEIIRQAGVRFDPQFGLGARYASGEELIFLADVRRARGTVCFQDVVVGIHARARSGDRLLSGGRVGVEKGAMIRRAFGLLPGVGYLLLFVARNLFKPGMTGRGAFMKNAVIGFFSR